MKRIPSYILLFLFVISIFPLQWFNFCTTHPFGHNHHHENIVNDNHEHQAHEDNHANVVHGTCKIRYVNYGYWPPMECLKVYNNTDDSQLPDNSVQLKPTIQILAFAAVYYELLEIKFEEINFKKPPDPGGRLECPLINAYSFRGPPFLIL